jgi:hypothetical protein
MTSFAHKLMVSCLGLVFVFAAAPAAAKARKHKKPVAMHAATVAAKTGYRGANLFPAGPVYHANDYLGDDPDPFIRLQLQRDIGSHYGGEP